MKKLITLLAITSAFVFAGCEKTTAAQACNQVESGSVPQGNDDEERYCVKNGQVVGEIDNAGYSGWEADED